MAGKPIRLIVVGCAAFIAATVWRLQPTSSPHAEVAVPLAPAAAPPLSPDIPEANPDELEAGQLARGPAEGIAQDIPPTGSLPSEELLVRAFESAKPMSEAQRQAREELILRIGFPPERMDWIQRRSADLIRARQQRLREELAKGIPLDQAESAAYAQDPDLDLLDEIGEEEYVRYRLVSGRTAGIAVSRTTSWPLLERAGLREADEIIRYDGQRIFNIAQLNSLASRGTPGEPVTIDVLRDRATILLTLPREQLDLPRTLATPPDFERLLRVETAR